MMPRRSGAGALLRLRRGIALLAVLSMAVLPAGAASAAPVGLADQHPEAFAHPALRALGLRYARLIVPWNAATSDPAAVQAWLTATAAAGMAPHVAFEHLRGERCPASPCAAPSRARYRAAVAAFHAHFPQVTTFTTWNEANHESQPVAGHPELVAGYYDELRATCPACTIVAGDVLDSGDYAAWLRRFLAASTTPPQLWGLHDYSDTTYGRSTGVDAVLATVPGELWFEETGGIVAYRRASGEIALHYDEARATRAVDHAFALARARPRVTRMYLYQWRAAPGDRFDAGLLRPDGVARLSYTALARNLDATAAAAAPSAAARTVEPLRWRVRWAPKRPRRLVVRVTCRITGHRCHGRVRIAVRTGKRIRRLVTHRYRTTPKHRTWRTRIRIGRRLARRIRRTRAARRRVVLTVSPVLPAGARTKLARRLRRPR